MMRYEDMIAGLERAGHDVSGVKLPPGDDDMPMATKLTAASLTLDGLARVINDAIDIEIFPLEQRIATLERAMPKPRVRVAAGSRRV
jgi:hypothetical protein